MGGKSAQLVDIKRKLHNLKDESRTKKQVGPINVAEVVNLAQEMFRSSVIPDDAAASSEAPINPRGNATGLLAELEKAKALMAELDSVKTMTIRWHKELMDEAKQRHAENVAHGIETSRENADSLIIGVKAAKAESVTMAME